MKGLWKKVSLMAAAVLLLCVMLTGCMSDKYANSEYTGTWKATKASMSGVSLDVNKVIGSFVLELEADGDAKAVIKGHAQRLVKGLRRRLMHLLGFFRHQGPDN